MNRNDYRRALIMLRSLKGGASGYVRLERRTLTGSLQFTVHSAPTNAQLYAVLLYRKNGIWNAVKADAFGAPRYGQIGMVWTFDPRNIGGRTLEQYELAAVVEKHGNECEPILCGNLNGTVNADFAQIRTAVCRLFTPVRVSSAPIPPITAPETQPVDRLPDVAESPVDIPKAAAPSDASSEIIQPTADTQIICEQSADRSEKAVDTELRTLENTEHDQPIDQPSDCAEPRNTAASAELDDVAASAPTVGQAGSVQQCSVSSSADGAVTRAVLSPSAYPAAKSDAPSEAAVVELDEFDTPADMPIEPDEFDMPAAAPIEPDEFDMPAAAPIEPDELDVPAAAPIEPDEFDMPARSAAEAESPERCAAASDEPAAQTVLSRSTYPAVKRDTSPEAASAEPDKSNIPIESDEFDTPAASIEPDEFDIPADDRFSTPAKLSSVNNEDAPAEQQSSPQTPTAGEQLALSDPDAAWHESIEPLHQLFFSQEAVVPFETENFVFIRAPLYEVETASSCLIGLYCENGVPARVCYALPAEYTPEPPVGLEGYLWRGSHTRGYWITYENVPAPDSSCTS